MLYIPKKIEYIIDTLCLNGFEAYIVGGCVRDMLLGLKPHDFDVTTSAKPEQIISLFEKTAPTGIKHGTVTVIIDKEPVEVTTFRTDGDYTDCRRPDNVIFVTNLKEDLARRDFTVNAMAYNNKKGLMDFFGGKADLQNKILRAVGDPELRFNEDALRILRLFRFSSVLGFNIEENTLTSAIKYAPLLKKISSERIMTELKKAVCGKNPTAMKPLTDCGGLRFIGVNKSPDYEKLKNFYSNRNLALYTFFYLSGADIEKSLDILKAANEIKSYCKALEKLRNFDLPKTKPEIKQMLCTCTHDVLRDYLLLRSIIYNDKIKDTYLMLNEIITNNEPYKLSDLKVNGNDIISLGINGAQVGEILSKLQKDVFENPLNNRNDMLLEKARQFNRN